MAQQSSSLSICHDCQDALTDVSLGNLLDTDLRLDESLQQRMDVLGLDLSDVCERYSAYLKQSGDKTATPGRVKPIIERILSGKGTTVKTWMGIVFSLGGKLRVVWETERSVVIKEESTNELD
jgi:hypothetical protein